MAKISVIVPVYNVEKYLHQCIDSLIRQTYQDLEIILVNDGSTDNSGAICNQKSAEDSRIVVVHKENSGLSLARYEGIMKAQSEYICFLDSDDYYEANFCEKMILAMENHSADLVECAYKKIRNNGSNEHMIWSQEVLLNRTEFLDRVVKRTIVTGSEAVVVWNKIYKRSLIVECVQDYGENPLEDYLFNMQYYRKVNRYVYLPECLTNYRQVSNSLSRRCNPKTIEVLNHVERWKKECLEEMGLGTAEDKRHAAQWYVNYVQNFLKAYLRSQEKNKRCFIMSSLKNSVLTEKCRLIAGANRFATQIVKQYYAKAYRQLWFDMVLSVIKRKLAVIKNKVIR